MTLTENDILGDLLLFSYYLIEHRPLIAGKVLIEGWVGKTPLYNLYISPPCLKCLSLLTQLFFFFSR